MNDAILRELQTIKDNLVFLTERVRQLVTLRSCVGRRLCRLLFVLLVGTQRGRRNTSYGY